MTSGGELVTQWLRNIERKRPADPRIDILLEVGAVLDGCTEAGRDDLIRIGKLEVEGEGVGYWVDDLSGVAAKQVFCAWFPITGGLMFEDFEAGKWQTVLRAWYDEHRRFARRLLASGELV